MKRALGDWLLLGLTGAAVLVVLALMAVLFGLILVEGVP